MNVGVLDTMQCCLFDGQHQEKIVNTFGTTAGKDLIFTISVDYFVANHYFLVEFERIIREI